MASRQTRRRDARVVRRWSTSFGNGLCGRTHCGDDRLDQHRRARHGWDRARDGGARCRRGRCNLRQPRCADPRSSAALRVGTRTNAADRGPIGHQGSGAAMEHAFAALPVDSDSALDALAARAARASIVLIGEASHGTQDFYAMRAALTRRLLADHGFRAVTLEADWPDTFRVHRFITGRSDDADALQALADFRRFPAWMWRNETMREFVDWLAQFNRARPVGERVGLFGLDLYSLYGSIESVLQYLDRVDPHAAARARARYRCFEYFGDDPQGYALAVMQGGESCEDEAVAQLVEMRRHAMLPLARSSGDDEEFFSAEQ